MGPVSGVKWTHWARFADVDYRAERPILPAVIGAVVTSRTTLNLRARPDMTSQVLAKLPNGEVLPVLKDGQVLADWLMVYYAFGVAYVMKKYVSVGAQPAKPQPVTEVPPPAPVELRTLRYTPGLPIMRGDDVALLQGRLAALGYKPGAVDGEYGPKTKAAVLSFQLDAFPAMSKEWDGVVGAKTWARVNN